MPICIMVLEKPIRKFYCCGIPIQYFEDIVKSANETTTRDGKERVPRTLLENLDITFEQEDYDIDISTKSPSKEITSSALS